MSKQTIQDNPTETVLVTKEFVKDIAHAVGSLAQYFVSHYFLEHGESPDIENEEALIMQACEYLRTGGAK